MDSEDLIEAAPHTEAILQVEPDYEEAKDRLSQGALSLRIGARYYLEALPSHSREGFELARVFYEQSLFFGNDQAAVNLGYVYAYGRLGVADEEKAGSYFYQGMKMGNPEGAMKYGDYLRMYGSVPESDDLAFKLYDMAYDLAQSVDEDDWIAGLALRLATCYEHGNGVEADQIDALAFYLQAAQRYQICVDDGDAHYRKRLQEAEAGVSRLQALGVRVAEEPLPSGASFNWDGDLLDSFGVPLEAGFYRDATGTIFLARKKFARERARIEFRRNVAASPLSMYASLSGGLESDGSRDFIVDFKHASRSGGFSIEGAEIRSWLSVDGENGSAECEIGQSEARLLWGKICDLGIVFWNDEYVSFKPDESSFQWRICVNGDCGSFESVGASVGPNNLESLIELLDGCLK